MAPVDHDVQEKKEKATRQAILLTQVEKNIMSSKKAKEKIVNGGETREKDARVRRARTNRAPRGVYMCQTREWAGGWGCGAGASRERAGDEERSRPDEKRNREQTECVSRQREERDKHKHSRKGGWKIFGGGGGENRLNNRVPNQKRRRGQWRDNGVIEIGRGKRGEAKRQGDMGRKTGQVTRKRDKWRGRARGRRQGENLRGRRF